MIQFCAKKSGPEHAFVRLTASSATTEPRSSLVEGDEGSYRPKL